MADGSPNPTPGTSSAHELFVRALMARGVSIARMTGDGRYIIELAGDELTVNLENVAAEYARDGDPAIVEALVESILHGRHELPPWSQAKSRVRYIAESTRLELPGIIHDRVTESLNRVIAYVHPGETGVRWLTEADLLAWMIQGDELVAAADENSAAMLTAESLIVDHPEGCPLAFFDIDTPFKASLIFSPNFKEIVSRAFWPVNAILPCRDFLFLWPDGDQRLIQHMGHVVMQEHHRSGYPLTTEVLRIADDEIVVVGRFAPKTPPQDKPASA